MTLDAQTVILGLLGIVCSLLAYWATRLEGRVDELKESQCRIVEEMTRTMCRARIAGSETDRSLRGLNVWTVNLIESPTPYVQGGIMATKQDLQIVKTLARIEKKVDALREEQEAANRKTILKGAFSGGLSGVLVSAAVSYAQLLLGVK